MQWQRIADWGRRHQRKLTAALVLFFAVAGTTAVSTAPIEGSEIPPDWLAYVLIIGAAITVWWWRTNPLPALAVCTLLVMVSWVRDYPNQIDPMLFLLFFAATRYGGADRPRVWRYVGIALAAISLLATIGVMVPTEDLPAVAIIGIFVVHGTCAAIGEALYQRRQYVSELEQRAASLEADLENKAALAAVEERTRIAREMHDIIAHGMSSVVVQAQAAQSVVDTNPTKAREVLETIETIGRDSVDEMRRMLGVLRANQDEIELEPQPGFTDLDQLARAAREAGVDVNVEISGNARLLPPGLELTGYRVVQEALTNVIRHAGRPVQVDAHVEYNENSVEITVADDGLGAAVAATNTSSGHGLLGMRERVEIYSGTFSAGPCVGGGFKVRVSLPLPARISA